MAAVAAVVLIVVFGLAIVVIRRRRRERLSLAPLPLIPFSAGRSGVGPPPRPVTGFQPPVPSPNQDWAAAPTPGWAAPVVAERPPVPPAPSPYAPPVAPASAPATRGSYAAAGNPLAGTALPNDAVVGAAVDGESVRYWRPADGTLQFLPGRLEVIAGRDAGQEIRFVRTPGPEGTRVTFGRAEGAPYRHVQLREPTVSRAHARMTLEVGSSGGGGNGSGGANGAKWRLENLSATNPVVVNGRALAADEGPACSVVLGEGDRIEMGEVVFRFHEK